MTHLLINQNVNLRREYLVSKVNEYLGTEFERFAQLHGNPDIHIVEFTEGESIKIEDVKQLQKELIFQPFKEKYQLGIICYAHNMTVEAQNAMLKSLEEQGEKTIYFLLVGSEGGLLDTIVSRCVKHYVKETEIESEAVQTNADMIYNLSKSFKDLMLEASQIGSEDEDIYINQLMTNIVDKIKHCSNNPELQRKLIKSFNSLHRAKPGQNKKLLIESSLINGFQEN